MKKLIPLAGFVLIEAIDEGEHRTSSNLVLPEKAKEKPAKGRIVEVGDGIIHYEGGVNSHTQTYFSKEECQVKKGDIVIFYRWGTQEIQEGNKKLLLVKFSDIQAVYE